MFSGGMWPGRWRRVLSSPFESCFGDLLDCLQRSHDLAVWGSLGMVPCKRAEGGGLRRTGARNPQGQRAPEAKMKAGARDRCCADVCAQGRKGLLFPARRNDLVRILFIFCLNTYFCTAKEKGSAITQGRCSSLSSVDEV